MDSSERVLLPGMQGRIFFMRTRRIIEIVLALGILTSVMPVVLGAEAPDINQDAIGQTPPRLSLTTGQVSFWRPGAEEWSQAEIFLQ